MEAQERTKTINPINIKGLAANANVDYQRLHRGITTHELTNLTGKERGRIIAHFKKAYDLLLEMDTKINGL